MFLAHGKACSRMQRQKARQRMRVRPLGPWGVGALGRLGTGALEGAPEAAEAEGTPEAVAVRLLTAATRGCWLARCWMRWMWV